MKQKQGSWLWSDWDNENYNTDDENSVGILNKLEIEAVTDVVQVKGIVKDW